MIDSGLAAALSKLGNPLTERERAVLVAAADGATIRDIANKPFLSEGTVRNNLSTTIQKLEVRNRTEAVRLAQHKGWI